MAACGNNEEWHRRNMAKIKAIMANNKYHRNENESSASANGENNGGIGSNGISGESIEIIIKL
jgi:hypothetical protein